MKTCTACGEAKAVAEFRKRKASPDGLTAACKKCLRARESEWHVANRDRRNAKSLEYYEGNKDRARIAMAKWRESNPGYDARKSAERRDAFPDEFKKWRESNPNYHAEWKRKNADKVREYARKRRAKAAENGAYPYTESEVLEMWGEKCAYCEGPYEHIEHVNPISRGGEDAIWNVVPACSSCNWSKGYKTLDEWRGPRIADGKFAARRSEVLSCLGNLRVGREVH